jgi:hypothetical protein
MIPSHVSYVASHRHQERIDTASRIRDIRQARRDGTLTVERPVQRRLTAARLAAVMTALKSAIHF